MIFDTDHALERRQMRRKLSIWRIVAILSLILLVAFAGYSLVAESPDMKRKSPHIAKLNIDGVILGEQRKLDLIKKLEESDAVKGVVLTVNSPGGSTSGGEALFEALTKLAKKKPLVTSMDGIATSAGYMISLPAERIFARRSTITGSIGVIFQYTDVTKLMDTIGVEIRAIKSAPLKAEPNPFSRRNPEAEAMIQRMIDDSFQWFVDLVADRRPFDRETTLKLADGRVVTGGQALELQLIDELGGPENAKNWLIKQHKLPDSLELMEWKPAPLREGLPFGLASKFFSKWVPAPLFDLIDTRKQVGKLDGLVSVWQAQKSEQ